MSDNVTLGVNGYGEQVVFDPDANMVFLLTSCCESTGKGSAESETGVVCRSCYEPINAAFGTGATLADGLDSVRDWLETTAFDGDVGASVRTDEAMEKLSLVLTYSLF